VADDQVYVDDAISAAHYLNRDGLNRLLAAAKAKPRPYERAGLLSDLLDGGGAWVRNEPRRSGRGYTG
jgi:hypothetical protein